MGNKFSTIKERVLQIAEIKGLSKKPFIESIGMTYGNFTGKAKDTPLNSDAISNILLKCSDVNSDWLLTGQGEMLKQTAATASAEPTPVILNTEPPKSGYTAVPVVDIEAAAGFGTTNADYIDRSQLLYLPNAMLRGSGDRLCIGVVGESMMPTLHEGTQVVVRRLRRAEWEAGIENGNIYVVTNRQGDTYIKRVKNRLKTDGVVTLVSDNPNQRKYKPFDMTADELHHIWATELFISDTVVNCAEYVTAADDEMIEVKDRIAELSETVERLVQKVEKGS